MELILAALAAGASAGITETTSGAIGDAYRGLRDGLRDRIAAREERAAPDLDGPAPDTSADTELWRVRLSAALVGSGADQDEAVLADADRLLELLEPPGIRSDRYVDARDSKGIQVGDRNTQTNHFS
ncbi:hypothetical protein RM704_05720 [Streptomyces sp. DSM 3412]|uniref:RHIM domain-containing protein n=1 Tax=Streptomyces gottesmaniae TaxID=3075518 RepID=A0ABU2YSN1_9ACTN|nr:hypothetical protein [Streptomyces sp. DSM 3412]MDT0566991.1 hypothetical protein [Streptomyces sp. DSM 3412]